MMLEVAQRIKELRVIKGLSQDELALKMGYRTRSSINKIEKGLNILPLKKLEKMAKILGTSTEYLLNGHQSKNLLDEKSMTLGERIREKRKAKGLTIRDMGEVLNLSYSIVAKYERNEVPITTIMLEKLAKILGTSTEYLLKGDSDFDSIDINNFSNKRLGDRIKYLRKKKNLSQEKLGELIGVNIQNVYRYEKGMITDLPISRIEKLAEALDTTVEYLVGDSQLIGVENRLKYLRKNKGLTLEQLAEIFSNRHNANIHKSMISNWENNKVQPSIDSLNMYTSYFNVSLDYLLNGTEIIEPEPYVENLGVEIVPKIETINEVDYVSSRTIAEQLGKRHSDVLESLENIIKNSSTEISVQWFLNSTYKDNSGKANKEYLLTRDGFTLYMFNIQGYNDFKIAYIQKFNEMEQLLLNRTMDDLYKLKFMSFKLDLLYKILSGTSTPKDFDDWKEFIFNNDMNEELLACEVKNRERYNARGNKIKTITLEFETMDDPVLTRIPV